MKKTTWVQITNKGEIELGGLHLMGVSSKREDEDKIGFFGSGNKYALALLLREKIPVRIFSGKKEVRIETEQVMFRGKLFEQIVIDGEKTSLTTSMGPDWETWFAIRELYCNAVDEGSPDIKITQEPKGVAGKTSVFVALTVQLEDFFKNIERFILLGGRTNRSIENTGYGKVELLAREGEEFICYRKGIRIYPKNATKSLYWYNFDKIEINESRTYQYEHQVKERIASYFAVTSNKMTIENYLRNWKGNFEENLNWEYVSDKLSDMWHSILLGKRVYPENLAIHSGDFEGKSNSFIVPEQLAMKISKQFKDIEVVGMKGDKQFKELVATTAEEKLISTAIEQLTNVGYRIDSKIVIVETMTSDVIAWYDKESDIIYHARKHLNSIKEVKNTLLEEHFHAIGHNDGQREFVTFLIDELINALDKPLTDNKDI